MAEPDPEFQPQLSIDDILVMTVEELRYECLRREIDAIGLTKPAIQRLLLEHISATQMSTSANWAGQVFPLVELSQDTRPLTPRRAPLPDDNSPTTEVMSEGHPPPPVDHTSSSGEIRIHVHQTGLGQTRQGLGSQQQSNVRDSEPSDRPNGSSDLQLQLRRMELEFEERERQRQREHEERERERQFELRKYELESRRLSTTASAPEHPPTFRVDAAVKLIPKFTEHDVETFLISFEKIAELNAFPPDKYAAVLQAHLTGKALKVFTELSVEECRDYPTLKAALLNAYSVVPEVYRKRFRGLTKSHSETYSEFAFRLNIQFARWIESEGAHSDVNLLRDLIQREQFNSSVDTDLRLWLIDQKPKTLADAARLADQFVAVRKAERPTFKGHDWKTKPIIESGRGKTGFGQHSSALSNSAVNTRAETKPHGFEGKSKLTGFIGDKGSKVVCYYCKKPGHIMSACHKRLAKENPDKASVGLVTTELNPKAQAFAEDPVIQKDDEVDPRFKSHCALVTVVAPNCSRHVVRALRDTGALQSLVCSQTVPESDYSLTGEHRLIKGVTGEIVSVPLVSITIKGKLCSGTFLCGLVPTLPIGVDLLIGNDLCPDVPPVVVTVVTRSQTAALRQQASQNSAQVTKPVPDHNDPSEVLDLSNMGLTSLFEESETSASVPFELVDRAELVRLQQSDPDLLSLFELVGKDDDRYSLLSGVLIRNWRDKLAPPESSVHQIVVPTTLRAKLLQIAHDIPAAGHLGVAKTRNRLLRHFYWPSLSRDTKNYCRSCDICQRLGKGKNPAPAPLQSIPLVNEPFVQIAIDIIGPLPICKESGNRYILTVLDLCTHFPEAVPLKQHTAADVAQALGTVFSRYGFPQEILSDQGSDFMSELMQVFLNDFAINHVRASPYHPQTNGACERFNGTLKTMLRSLTEQFPDSWDTALPWVLFAYREVPVETLGCSPFELMFGRSVPGPLSLVKSAWLRETDLSTAKRSVVEFMLNTRQHLHHALELANQQATQERTKAKVWYDRRARLRTFEPGDKVLVLLPIPGNPLQTKFHGPYEVEQQVGPVDYVISTPNRRKKKRVCHINLLKKYHERDPELDPLSTTGVDIMLQQTVSDAPECTAPTTLAPLTAIPDSQLSKTGQQLTSSQTSDLSSLLTEFADVFSDAPGRTTLGVHHIELFPDTRPIRCTPYRLSPDKAKVLKEELSNLLDQGIVEESSSPWASPIVMVPKADGTLRLCTDFRKVNSVTVPDPFPLPRIEDLLDRVGKAKYLTKLDMTRGYWQVPLDDVSVPISAFVTPHGHFQWRYMPFGLRNAPATFSRLVNKLLMGLEGFCAAYLDDIIIFSDTWEEHLSHIRAVLTRVREAYLTLSPKKCHFAVAEVDYLGHHVGLGRVQPRAQKVQALLSFPAPTTRRQLQQFLGLAGYYRKFVPHFAQITSCLSDLLKKGTKFVWTPQTERAFLDLKSRLATQPILRPPDFTKPFCLAVDASDVAIGAVLFQEVEGLEHPICYYSKKLDCHQKRYSTVEKEALGLIQAVRTFSVYFGSSPVRVYTDHSPLQFLQRMSSQNQKLLRWSLELEQYNLDVKHRPGKENTIPDILSRPAS